jgi:hypothetical protein
MKTGIWIGAVALLCVAQGVQAQYAASTKSQPAAQYKLDIIPLGGYAWTLAQDVTYDYPPKYASIDFDDAGYYGVAIDFNLAPKSYKTTQLRLEWRRSDGQLSARGPLLSQPVKVDAAIEYWQIGGLGGVKRGNVMPFGVITLGGSRLIANNQDNWKFSMIFGLGVKIETQGRLGFMIQGNWPITFTDTWGGVSIGTGGAGLAIGGTGISQIDVGGGLIIKM